MAPRNLHRSIFSPHRGTDDKGAPWFRARSSSNSILMKIQYTSRRSTPPWTRRSRSFPSFWASWKRSWMPPKPSPRMRPSTGISRPCSCSPSSGKRGPFPWSGPSFACPGTSRMPCWAICPPKAFPRSWPPPAAGTPRPWQPSPRIREQVDQVGAAGEYACVRLPGIPEDLVGISRAVVEKGFHAGSRMSGAPVRVSGDHADRFQDVRIGPAAT